MRNVSDNLKKKVVEKIKIYFIFNNIFPTIVLFMAYDEKYGTAIRNIVDNRMRRKRFALWMTKATVTHSEYVANTYCFSTAKKLFRERISILYVYLNCL
jgi:hypothetical protein